MSYIKSYKNQNYLLPLNIKDLFSKNHVCYLIEQMCDELDYSKFDEKYAGPGHPAYHPRIPLKVLLMAGVDGIQSSRRMSKNSQENVVYIFLAEKTQPDFRTISDFRKENKQLFKDVAMQLKLFALKKGLIDLSHLFVDGTTIQANANNTHIISKETVEQLEKYIDKMVEKGIEVDEEEDKIFGDRGLHELPEELHDPNKRRPEVEKMVKEINKAITDRNIDDVNDIKKELHDVKQFMEKNNTKKYSFIDNDSRFMLSKKGRKELSYNAQLVVDKNGLILAEDVVQDCDDRNQLVPGINNVEKIFGRLPKGTIIGADAGYEKGEALQYLEERGMDLFVPGKNMKRDSAKKKFAKANFTYDEEKDEYICPEHKRLTPGGKFFDKRLKQFVIQYRAKRSVCQMCPKRALCCKNQSNRLISALPQNKLFIRMKEKIQSEKGKLIMKMRQQTVERSFADIKHNKKLRGFLLRGRKKVNIEFNLACIAHNLVMINNKLKVSAGC